MKITRTETFDLAYRFVTETNLNIFLTGKAGTGKTTFLKYLREHSYKKMVVAAPTGVAAINAGGVTLHSLFQLPFSPFIPEKKSNLPTSFGSLSPGDPNAKNTGALNSHSLLSKIRFNREKLYLLRNLELLIIDEASMVASHTVDAIDTLLRSIRRRHNLPFGGVQVLFIGDLHQLQPVVKNDEWQILKNYYSSIFFFDSLVLKEHIPVMIELKEIFRQKDDIFINLLNEIRHNNLSSHNYDLLNSRLMAPQSGGVETIPPDGHFYSGSEGAVTLTTHNAQADQINEKKLGKLKTKSFSFKAKITGDFPEHIFPAEPELILREGAQVMFIKNDNESKKYFNGKTGVIASLSDSGIQVKCQGDTEAIWVGKQEWLNINYSLHPESREIIENVLGSFEQYPLRLAWAITIHKSQGLTFGKVIIDAENAFANGQVYVALSRCTSLEGLFLTSPINRKFLGAHQNLKDWQEKNQDEKNLSQKLIESRQKFLLGELQAIFSWQKWIYELQVLNSILFDNKESLPPDTAIWIREIIDKQQELDGVAKKFKERISQLCSQNPLVEENLILQQRIKDAANYFSGELEQWKEKFIQHPISTDTKKIAGPVDRELNEINFIFHEILHKINFCKNGFVLSDFLEQGKKIIQPVLKVTSSYEQKQVKNISPKDSMNPGLYIKIAELRKHFGDINNMPLFQIFSNATIKNVCESLPLNKESLLKVKGFGMVKVSQYGEEVIELVKEYCEENNIVPNEITVEKRVKKSKQNKKTNNTVGETVRHFKEGKTIDEIAALRNFTPGTIEGHLAQAIKSNTIKIETVLPPEEVKKIAALFPTPLQESISLSAIKGQSTDEVSYGKLKMVLAWLQRENK